MFFSTARLDTPIFTDIASAVIEGSEITKSIIFCPVLLTLLDASSPFTPNLFSELFSFTPNLSAFTPNLFSELFSFTPNFLSETPPFTGYFFEGTVYPVGHLFYGDSTILAPIQIIESGEE